MKRSEVIGELLNAYYNQEGKRTTKGMEKEVVQKSIKIIEFFEKEEERLIANKEV